MPNTCRCGHPRTVHEHYRAGTECALCRCPAYHPRGWAHWIAGAGVAAVLVALGAAGTAWTSLALIGVVVVSVGVLTRN